MHELYLLRLFAPWITGLLFVPSFLFVALSFCSASSPKMMTNRIDGSCHVLGWQLTDIFLHMCQQTRCCSSFLPLGAKGSTEPKTPQDSKQRKSNSKVALGVNPKDFSSVSVTFSHFWVIFSLLWGRPPESLLSYFLLL